MAQPFAGEHEGPVVCLLGLFLLAGCVKSPGPGAAMPAPAVAAERVSQFGGIRVEGSAGFVKQVEAALALLQKRAAREFAEIQEYVKCIREGQRSGMWAFVDPPTYEMSKKTALASLTWCAGTIAHDAYHSKLYHVYRKSHGGPVPDHVWTGQEREKECIAYQLVVLRKIRAPAGEIEHLAKSDGGYADADGDGKYTWADYAVRDW